MGERQVSSNRTINASAADIFAVLTDPTKHSLFDGSGTLQGEIFGPDQLELGDEFGMKMKMFRMPYKITSTVKEFEQDRLIAWAHKGEHLWRYELEPVGDATKVTETFDYEPAKAARIYELVGFPKRNLASIEATLERLDAFMAVNT